MSDEITITQRESAILASAPGWECRSARCADPEGKWVVICWGPGMSEALVRAATPFPPEARRYAWPINGDGHVVPMDDPPTEEEVVSFLRKTMAEHQPPADGAA
jgi:hypothetical protein